MVKIKAGDVVLDDANKCWIVTAISRMPHTHPHGLVHLVILGRPHERRNDVFTSRLQNVSLDA